MKKWYFILLSALVCIQCSNNDQPIEDQQQRLSGAAKSLDDWYFERAYPSGTLDMAAYETAFYEHKSLLSAWSPRTEWESLGPQNV